MILHPPYIISSRLLPALRVSDNCWLSVEPYRDKRNGRLEWTWFIDVHSEPFKWEYTGRELETHGCNPAEALSSLVAFLSASAESYWYRISKREMEIDPDSNESLFPPPIPEWAYHYSSELDMLSIELEESKGIEH